MSSDRDEPDIPSVGARGSAAARIWIFFLAGPVIWFGHFMLVYLLGEVLCKPLRNDIAVANLPLVSFLTVVATIVAAAATVVFAVGSYRRWRAADTDGNNSTMSVGGVLLGLLFFVAVLFTGAPALFLQPC